MSVGKDTAMIILGKKGKRHSEPHDDMDFDDDEYEEEDEMEEYSDEQHEMAEELITQ